MRWLRYDERVSDELARMGRAGSISRISCTRRLPPRCGRYDGLASAVSRGHSPGTESAVDGVDSIATLERSGQQWLLVLDPYGEWGVPGFRNMAFFDGLEVDVTDNED
jgi:hypothetical protein